MKELDSINFLTFRQKIEKSVEIQKSDTSDHLNKQLSG